MKKRLLNNLGLKALSIFLAFFVWLVVVNVSNPKVTKSQEVPIEVLNAEVLTSAEKTYEIVGKETVTVSYKVRTRDVSSITAADFHAYIDLADLYDITGSVPVTLEINRDKELLIDSPVPKPGVVRIATEDLQRKRFDLKVDTKEGVPEDGYAVGEITISPDFVYANGPVSLVGQISHIGIEINNIENANTDISGSATPVFYDANGNKLSLGDKVTLNSDEINYEVAILKVKNLSLNFEVTGAVANGYRFTGVESEVKTIPVVGMKSVLASLSTLTISSSELDLTGSTSDKIVKLDVSQFLPPSAAIVDNVEKNITITLKVEPLTTKTFTINTKDLIQEGTSDLYDYTMDKPQLEVVIRGLEEDLNSLSEVDFNAKLDVSKMTPGKYKGTLSINVGEGFEIVSYTEFGVTVVLSEEGIPTTEDASVEVGAGGTADSEAAEKTTAGNETSRAATE